MSERFLKFIPSEEAMWLLKKRGHAFRLLAIIAEDARRHEGDPDGLKPGECLIGGHENYDMSEQNYRTAKDILVKRQHIEIVETCRTRGKSTTGVTTVNTKVRILSSNVWDINLEEGNDRGNDRPTTVQRPSNDRLQEPIRMKKEKKEKKEKKDIPPNPPFSVLSKIKFRELVELTQAEHDTLLAKNGAEFLSAMLDVLDAYKGSSGKKYESDFHTMKQGGWVAERVKKDLENQKNANEKNLRLAPGRKVPPGNDPSRPTKFEPSRVLRGDEPAIVSGNSGALHD